MPRSFRGAVAVAILLLLALLAGCSSHSRAADPSSAPYSPQGVAVGEGAAASRMVFWTNCKDVVALDNAQLDEWHRRGVGGFVCQIQHLAKLGGDQDFTGDPHAPLTGSNYSLQRQIRDSKIVPRAKARGIKVWLGLYLSNASNRGTPLAEWFDDSAWSTVLPELGDIAGAAHTLGFAGLAFDEELYDKGSTWSWNYDNRHSESEVRAKVRERGVQVMRAIVRAFPRVEIVDYGAYFPDSWAELVQEQVNNVPHAYSTSVQINFWDGLTRVPGYGPIRFMDATFYKTAQLSGASWDNAMTYNDNRLMAYFSRHLSNWAYASSRINVSPFAWIDGDVQNEGGFTAPRSPSYVADQLAAFHRWGMGGAFAVYAYNGLDNKFDYGPYVTGMQAAAKPGPVDPQPPSLTITASRRKGRAVVVSGTATDAMAMRSVLWRAGARAGAAAMTWSVTGGDYRTGYRWHMDWTATIPAASKQAITFTAVDTRNNTAQVTRPAP